MLRDFAKAVRELRRNFGGAFATYRPDLHYMRGPGPKWHAKHDGLMPTASAIGASARPAMREMAERRA